MQQLMGRVAIVRLLAAAAVISFAIVLWDLATGGFRIDLFGLRISSAEISKPLRNALVCAMVAAWLRDRSVEPARTTWAILTRAAPVVVGAFAVAWLATIAAYSARAVGGSDTYGYVSEARLWAAGRLIVPDRLAELAPSIGPCVAPLGYVPATTPGAIVPTYSPGLPLVMALAMKLSGRPGAVYAVVPLLGSLGIWLTYALATRAGYRLAGLYAAMAIGLSPIYLFQSLHPMSDVPATVWWLLAWVLAWTPGFIAAAASGLAVSLAILTRPNLAPLALFIVGAAMCARPRAVRAGLVLATTVPGCLAVAAVNAYLYGSPTTSGYGTLETLYEFGHVGANLRNYATWLLQLHSPAVLLGLIAPALVRRRAIWLMLGFATAVVLLYVFYAEFENWTYLRFILPALPILFVFTGVVLVAVVERLPMSARGAAATFLFAAALWHTRPFVLSEIAPGQQRFEQVARAVARAVPENAVVLSVVDTGSLRMYGHRETVRWELIRPEDLDRTVDVLNREGFVPYVLLEDFEEPVFRSRFGGHSDLARLDWPPAIEFYGQKRAKLYATRDREAFLAGRTVERTAIPLR